MRKNNFIYATATMLELKAYGFDLTDTLRYLVFCKLQKIELDQVISQEIDAAIQSKPVV